MDSGMICIMDSFIYLLSSLPPSLPPSLLPRAHERFFWERRGNGDWRVSPGPQLSLSHPPFFPPSLPPSLLPSC